MEINLKNKELKKCNSNLKRIRISMGMTQSDLASLSGINIKSIASYEQNPSKINKASVETVMKLSDSLGCDINDIIESNLIDY